MSASYLEDRLKFFHESEVNCSPHLDDVQNGCPAVSCLRSRSHLKVTLTRHCLQELSALFLKDDFKNFIEVESYVHLIKVMCRTHVLADQFHVKVTLQGHMFESLHDFMSAPYLQDA